MPTSPRIAFVARAAVLACLLLALPGCPRPPAPPPKVAPALTEEEALTAEVLQIRRGVEAVLRAQDEAVWKHWTEGAPIDIAATHAGHETLFSVETIRKIGRLRQLTRDAREQRALAYLHAHVVGEYLAGQLAEVTDAIANLEASMTFSYDGRELPYRELDRLLANEKSATVRHAMSDAATPAVKRLSQSLRRKDERITALVAELGYPSYQAFGAELHQTDLDRLGLLAEEILQVTQAPFTQVLGKLSQKELGIPLEQLRRSDIPRLFKPKGVDGFFPRETVLERADATFRGLGLDLGGIKNLRVDARELPRKNPRPLTVAVEVPGDVRLSVKPAAGMREQAALLHELGHALHFAFTQPGTRFELAKLGSPTVTEAFGNLTEDLIEDPLWLQEHAGLEGDKLTAYLAASSAHKLYLIRRAAGRLLYSLQLHRRQGEDGEKLYTAIMGRTYAVTFTADDAARYQVEAEDLYESVDNFRAWFLAGQLQGQLKARFGPAWWHAPAAGEFLKFLWAKGGTLSASELARLAGETQIKPDVLLLRLGTSLGVPISLPAQSATEIPETPPTAPPTPPVQVPATDAGAPTPAPAVDAGTP